MKTICSYCQEHLSGDPADTVISHGCCPECKDKELAKLNTYCIILFPHHKKAVVLDRKYNFLTDERAVWGKIKIGEIKETSKQFFAGQGIPDWAYSLEETGAYHVTVWLK